MTTLNFQFTFDFNITVTHNVVFVSLLNGGIYELVSLFAADATKGLSLVRTTGEVGTLPNVIGLITIVKFHDCTAMARIKQSCTSFCGVYQVILAEEFGGNMGRGKGMRDLDSWSCPTAFHTYHFRTPFFLVHGREARLPLISGNIVKPKLSSHSSYLNNHSMDTTEYINELNNNLNVAFDVIYDSHKNNRPDPQSNHFSVNDQVLLFNTQMTNKQQNRHRKLLLDWVGPYTITKINSPTTVDILDCNSKKAYNNFSFG
ncbi:hypothetical protein BCR42DRAFT_474470 [Absidia repens]|uniref:Uncharacterized protein n=1 Tax=Absidia repens TaxID=90262 RepID=A0A1X2HYY9_9FUNG|nr:hypothetical protein BCR42DRAFT_474470 [Absidia repens]